MLKCIRFFSHHDSSFPLAYVAVPGIQSTPSLLLDGSTSAFVPSQILASASESKFQSFPFCWYIVRLISTVYLPFLGTLTFAILQFFIYHWESHAGKKLILVFQLFDHVLYVFSIFMRSSQTFPLNVRHRVHSELYS